MPPPPGLTLRLHPSAHSAVTAVSRFDLPPLARAAPNAAAAMPPGLPPLKAPADSEPPLFCNLFRRMPRDHQAHPQSNHPRSATSAHASAVATQSARAPSSSLARGRVRCARSERLPAMRPHLELSSISASSRLAGRARYDERQRRQGDFQTSSDVAPARRLPLSCTCAITGASSIRLSRHAEHSFALACYIAVAPATTTIRDPLSSAAAATCRQQSLQHPSA